MAMEDVGRRRRSARISGGAVASGSVWESRMKTDEVRGGVKVFNGGDKEVGAEPVRRSSVGVSSERRKWKSEIEFEGLERHKTSAAQVSRLKSDSQRRSFSDSEKSPIQAQVQRKVRSERRMELGRSLDDGGGGIGSSIRVRRNLISDLVSASVESVHGVQSMQEKPESVNTVVDEPEKSCDSGDEAEIGNSPSEQAEEIDEQFGLCQENAISSNNSTQIHDCDNAEEEEEEDGIDEEDDEFEETEENSKIDIKEMDVPEQEHKPKKVILVEEEKPEKVVIKEKLEKVVIEEKTILHQLNTKPAPMASVTRRRAAMYQNHHQQQQKQPTKPAQSHDRFEQSPHTHSKLHSLVDLVMWRDVSRSAFVFGIGTFAIISSSYTQDLNISFISVISYLGLVYLASIFLYRSIICRGVVNTNDESCVVGEGEAVWLIKLFLPYLNEFLLKLRALFSGDPPTTMKLAVLLFVLARGGSSITIWKMAKFGFFGVFTVPKVCSSYSSQITAYGQFWIRRFGDAWESCTHKKAVAIAIFTLVWNLSSIVARVWAVFMVVVGVKYYQQSIMVRDDWVEEEEHEGDAASEIGETSTCTQNRGSGKGHGPTMVDLNKHKKSY